MANLQLTLENESKIQAMQSLRNSNTFYSCSRPTTFGLIEKTMKEMQQTQAVLDT
jgi:hypothetical protein